MRYAIVLFPVIVFLFGCAGTEQIDDAFYYPEIEKVTQVSTEDLMNWVLIGGAERELDDTNRAVFIKSTPGSKGATLVAPLGYSKYVEVSFAIRPLTPETQCEVFVSLSSMGARGIFVPPEAGFDGDIEFWTNGEVQNFMFSFHVKGRRDAVISRNPGMRRLGSGRDPVVEEGWYYITAVRYYRQLIFVVNGREVCRGGDFGHELPLGYIGIGIRGTDGSEFSGYIRDVTVITI